MMATTAMAKTAKAMAMAMAMVTVMEMAMPMMLLPSMVKMLMKTTAAIQGWQLNIDDWTTSMYVDNDGDDGNGRDGDGNSNGNGNGNNDDATAAAIGNTVDEDNCGASRMAIG
jgi:hypothetical protein